MLNKNTGESTTKTNSQPSENSNKMVRTVVYLTPKQYASYQTKAVLTQRYFAEVIRERLFNLLSMKAIGRYLSTKNITDIMAKTENTVSVQIYIPAATKQKLKQLQKTHGVTQSGLFRVALELDGDTHRKPIPH